MNQPPNDSALIRGFTMTFLAAGGTVLQEQFDLTQEQTAQWATETMVKIQGYFGENEKQVDAAGFSESEPDWVSNE